MIASKRFYLFPAIAFLGACTGGSGGEPAESALATPSFSIAVDPAPLAVPQGDTTSFLLTVTPSHGFTGTVDLTADGAPEGVALFGASILVPAVISISQPIALEVAPNAALGIANMKLIARSGSEIAFADLALTVIPPPPPPSPTFSISLNPLGIMLPQAGGATAQLTVTPYFGFQGSVTISLDGAPSGTTVDPLPIQFFVDAPVTQTLTIDVSAATLVGDYSLQFHADSGAIHKSASFPLIVLDGHPGIPQLGLSFGVKNFHFSWAPTPGASHYKLLEKVDASASYAQIGANLPATATSLDLPVALYEHAAASFKLQACNGLGCVDSNEISVTGGLQAAIGYFKASNAHASDHFGQSLAVSADGSTMAVGAPDEDGGSLNSGAVYVFTRAGETWVQQAYLKASNAEKDDRFGAALCLSADGIWLVVGAPGEDSAATGIDGDPADNSASNSGAAYCFIRNGANWIQQAYFKASNTGAGDAFGSSLALSADGLTLAVGAPLEDGSASGIDGDQASNSASNSGAAYAFVRNGAAWSQQAYTKASNPDSGDHFGSCVAISANGDTLAVGADEENGGATGINGDDADDSAANAGAAYAFVRTGSAWSQQAYLKASNTTAGSYFGTSASLAADGNTLAIGARDEGGSGAAYLFVRAGSAWSQESHLKASNAEAGDGFGQSLSLSADGNSLAVGADGEDSQAIAFDGAQGDNAATDSGAVYFFVRNGASWNPLRYLKASNTNAGDHFGAAVSLSGDGETLAIGSDDEDGTSAQNSGAAYLY